MEHLKTDLFSHGVAGAMAGGSVDFVTGEVGARFGAGTKDVNGCIEFTAFINIDLEDPDGGFNGSSLQSRGYGSGMVPSDDLGYGPAIGNGVISLEKAGTGQCSPANFSRFATIPQVWRNGSLKRILTDRQNWMAASQNAAGRPGRPSRGARQITSLST
jgi:hypothetical protein